MTYRVWGGGEGPDKGGGQIYKARYRGWDWEPRTACLHTKLGVCKRKGSVDTFMGGGKGDYWPALYLLGEGRQVWGQGWENYKGLGWLMGGMREVTRAHTGCPVALRTPLRTESWTL